MTGGAPIFRVLSFFRSAESDMLLSCDPFFVFGIFFTGAGLLDALRQVARRTMHSRRWTPTTLFDASIGERNYRVLWLLNTVVNHSSRACKR